MAGYHGWFNAPGDHSDMGWNHYAKEGKFEPGISKFDFWPETGEYPKVYKTPFTMADGKHAYLFSNYDSSTVSTHFRWMKEYGVDGIFLQRSVADLKDPVKRANDNQVFKYVIKYGKQFRRAVAVMYDFTGLNEGSGDLEIIEQDWKLLVDSFHLTNGGKDQTYLYHHAKPLVGIWGVGFPERHNDLVVTEKLIRFLKADPSYGGCSVLLGVPAYWRDFGFDTEKDSTLHRLIRQADIIRPWLVGRFTEKTYDTFKVRIKGDLAWCKQNRIDYVPIIFPGFSWHNMHPGKAGSQISRDRGKFYRRQINGTILAKAEMLYVAMFDEIDEGTAIFKLSKNPPEGFERLEPGIPSDYYLTLTGIASKMLKNRVRFTRAIPSTKK